MGWMRGQLTKREVYTESDQLTEADYMTYGECLLGVEAGGKAVQFNEYEFLFARDYLTTGRSRLTKETHEVYGDKEAFCARRKNIRMPRIIINWCRE